MDGWGRGRPHSYITNWIGYEKLKAEPGAGESIAALRGTSSPEIWTESSANPARGERRVSLHSPHSADLPKRERVRNAADAAYRKNRDSGAVQWNCTYKL